MKCRTVFRRAGPTALIGRRIASRATAALPSSSDPLRVFLVAGEPSGDGIGARLMRALCMEHGAPIEWAGVGGVAMEAQGMRSLFPMSDLSVMGFGELVPALPRLAFRLRQARTPVQRSALTPSVARQRHRVPAPRLQPVALAN
jgi:hypothetical protein